MTTQSIKQPAVYIMASKPYGTIYTGVTSNLVQRVYQHREDLVDGFTKEYGCKLLVYFDVYETMEHAIVREKQIKGGSRQRKIELIKGLNPDWSDLYLSIV